MSNIGLDFGTTNSIISFLDEETHGLSCFRKSAAESDYIPTVVSYRTRRGQTDIEIGNGARLRGEGNPEVCSRFKLRLGSRFDEILPGKQKTAHEAARDYIRCLLDSFRETVRTIDSMVMTIPDAWYREQINYTARENIRTILGETGLTPEQVAFQSEPVAAAAYFCWLWNQREKTPFTGKLLVIDYGGGTLDVTLCSVNAQGIIRTLDSFGTGEEGDGIEQGHAGSAFLSRVIRILCEEKGITPGEEVLAKARAELETCLIGQAALVTARMNDYLISPEDVEDADQVVFNLYTLQEIPVRCEHLLRAFSEINQPVLEQAVEQMKRSADYGDPDDIRIITVGGFSNFCCVENCVRRCFGSRHDAFDPRFPKLLSEENRALAIAKGAALIAGGKMHVEPTFSYGIGILAAGPSPDNREVYVDVEIPLILRNAVTEQYRTPVFNGSRVRVTSPDNLYIRIYQDFSGQRYIYRLDNKKDLTELFPSDGTNQVYEIGISVDTDNIPSLHIRSETGQIVTRSLNKILERLAIQKA